MVLPWSIEPMEATAELVSKKVELLAQQKAKVDRIYELLNGASPH